MNERKQERMKGQTDGRKLAVFGWMDGWMDGV